MCAETFAQGPKGYQLNVGKDPEHNFFKKREKLPFTLCGQTELSNIQCLANISLTDRLLKQHCSDPQDVRGYISDFSCSKNCFSFEKENEEYSSTTYKRAKGFLFCFVL